MDDVSARFWSDLIGRLSGPMTFRFILQPTMSLLQAWRDGSKNATLGRPPYFWSVLEHSDERTRLLKEGWRAVLRIILLGSAMDAIYHITVFRRINRRSSSSSPCCSPSSRMC
jgi:hypothetical protein